MRIPCEVLKQRLQAGLFDNVGQAFVATWEQDGLRGFFRGTGATLCREVPFYVAGMGLYAESKKVCNFHDSACLINVLVFINGIFILTYVLYSPKKRLTLSVVVLVFDFRLLNVYWSGNWVPWKQLLLELYLAAWRLL